MTPNYPDPNPKRSLVDDPLIDAGLDEILGGQAPPDLSARILAAIETRGLAGDAQSAEIWRPRPASSENGTWLSTPIGGASALPGWKKNDPKVSIGRWVAVAAACTALVAALAVGLRMRFVDPTPANRASELAQTPAADPASENLLSNDNAPAHRDGIASASSQADESQAGNDQDQSRLSPNEQFAETPTPRGFDQAPPFVAHSGSSASSSADKSNDYVARKSAPDSDAEVAAYIAGALRQHWRAAGVSPAPRAADGEWARRAYLRILGRLPTYEELTAYLEDASSSKQEELVNHLLYDDSYVEQYARHWSGVWTNVLIGRSGGTDEDDLADRAGLEQYLRRAFQFNRPYDQIVYELVSATGSNRPGAEGYNGAVNFLLGNYSQDFTLATSKTARVFLGKQLHCAQCHNHPFENWTQDDFWGLDAFFRQAAVVQEDDAARLTNRDFSGESGDMAKAEIYFDRLNGLRKVAYPKYLDGTTIDPHGQVATVDRRRVLASFLTESRDLSRALVNRLWSHFLGRGFVEPVDDMRPSNPPSHPELLDYLADQFLAHDHDVKRLMRWIVLSEAFSLSSRVTPQNLADSPGHGGPPLFSRYYTRQMDAEAAYDSLAMLASNGDRSSETFAELQRDRRSWLSQFTLDLETDEGDEANTFNGAIPQSLAMMNGELVERTITSEQGFLYHVCESEIRPAEKLERLFLATLARKPTRREIDAANRLLAERQGAMAAALQDLWWALVNSNEFILDH